MVQVNSHPAKPVDQAALRKELLRLILKNEAERRDQRKAPEK